ncbi:unnamed protein product [Mortierella alpina]
MNTNTSNRYAPYPSPSSSYSSSSNSSSSSTSTAPLSKHQMLTDLLESEFQPRRWIPVGPLGQEFLTVVTYNLLSNTLLQLDRSKFLDAGIAPNMLAWTERRARLLREIDSYEADVVCVQELDEDDYEGAFGTGMLVLGYDGRAFRRRNRSCEHGFGIFFKSHLATLVSDCPISFPQGVVQGADVPGVMLVLDVKVGQHLQRVCVATTHIPCNDCQGGLKRVGQVMALLSAAADLLQRNPGMVFILTGDFNAKRCDKLAKFITTGFLDLARMKIPAATLEAFMAQTQPLRDVLAPPSSVSTEPSPNSIEPDADLENTVVSHAMHTASVYDMKTIVDFIFHGSITGGRKLQVVSYLELPPSLERLKTGLPAGHLGSDHFALGAKFRIADRVAGSEWTGAYYIPLVGYMENVVEVDTTGWKRYFPLEVPQKPEEECESRYDNMPYLVGTSNK